VRKPHYREMATVTRAVRAPHAADWALSRGINALTTGELADLLDIPPAQVRQRLLAPTRRGEWISPARGLWVPVAPEFRTWGAPPGVEFIDRLARHLEVDYYIGWLSGAELHGAAHQAPQVFQVGVSRSIRDRRVGRTEFQFHHRARLTSLPHDEHMTRSGAARVSTLAGTALDVATDATVAGGIHNAATVLVELAEQPGFDIAAVVALADQFPVSTLRRLGWILDRVAAREDLDQLRAAALSGPQTPARLDPAADLVGQIDRRWRVRVNRDVVVDL
jgi:predicted transcriptional regulator of viral defense system